MSGTQDITGGLPRVTEIFEARKPKDPAVIAEIDGTVELLGEKRRGKRTIIVRSESGIEREHLVSHGKHLRVHAGDFVRAGEALVDGPLVPHDILRISGEEAVQQYLVREIQNVYRSQRVEINDKHIEIIVAQMLRKVRVEIARRHRPAARQRDGQVRVPRGQPGAGQVREDHREGRQRLRRRRDRAQATRWSRPTPRSRPSAATPAKGAKPKPATASTQLLGITKAAVQSSSFISAASFQETTKVLTEAALAGKVDHLVGLKENVILGHLVPAGTGFHTFQESEVRIRPAGARSPGRPRRRTCWPAASRCWKRPTKATANGRGRRGQEEHAQRRPGRQLGCAVGRQRQRRRIRGRRVARNAPHVPRRDWSIFGE